MREENTKQKLKKTLKALKNLWILYRTYNFIKQIYEWLV